jgi:uncharacterized protein with HEPN domain
MWRDAAYLLDILNAARKVRRFTTGVTEEEFENNDLVQSATMRELGIIGEAARKISQETRNAHPGIPWAEMIGMRNRVIHEYSRINLEKVWDTIQKDIPHLMALIEPLVPPPEDE